MFDDGGSVGRNTASEPQLIWIAGRWGGHGEESEELLSPLAVAVVPR